LSTVLGGDGSSPVLVLSYAYSGAGVVQDILATGTDLACTAGTGIVPLTAAAAETWSVAEGRPGQAMSRLALSSIRQLVTAQITVILANTGQGRRWCELVTAPPGAVDQFLRVFHGARVICVHRACTEVIRTGVRANPWGTYGPPLLPYLLSYQGNGVAALAAYWASSTEQLLAFEKANPRAVHRVRYEDVTADPGRALAEARAFLGLAVGLAGGEWPEPAGPVEPETADLAVPMEMIPQPLRERIARLESELGCLPRKADAGAAASPRSGDNAPRAAR
jgi:hypothetical protein